jgi:hypothetical protein
VEQSEQVTSAISAENQDNFAWPRAARKLRDRLDC